MIDSVLARNSAETGSGKSKISKEIIPIISEIGDKIVQAHYANVVAKKLGVPLEAVTEEIIKVDQPVSVAPQSEEKKEERTKRGVLEENLLKLIFASDPEGLTAKDIGGIIKQPINLKLIGEYKTFLAERQKHPKKGFEISEFGKSLPKELFTGFSKIVLGENRDSVENAEELKKELELVKKELKILAVKEKLEVLESQIREMEEKGENEMLLKAQQKFNELAKLRSTYEKDQGSGIILNEE